MRLANIIQQIPIFSQCNSTDLARIIPTISERTYGVGETLYSKDESAKLLYFILNGSVQVKNENSQLREITAGFIGSEVAIGLENYLSDGMAMKQTEVIIIPKETMKGLLTRNSSLHTFFYNELFNHYSSINEPIVLKHERRNVHHILPFNNMSLIGWLLALLLPIVVLYLGEHLGWRWDLHMFLTLFSSALMMWIFRLLDEIIPALMLIIGSLLLELAPTEVILGGYSTDIYFMALSVFGISIVLAASGLTYRMMLLLLRTMPDHSFWKGISVSILGCLLTTVVPSTFGRVELASYLFRDLSETTGYKRKGNAITQISTASYSGFTLLDHIFLSSTPVTLAVFALMPEQIQESIGWLYWFVGAIVACIVLIGLYTLALYYFFPNKEKTILTKEHIREQLTILGPLKQKEWIALIGITLFIIGVITTSFHRMDTTWIGLMIMFLFLIIGILKKDEFRTKIDWGFMIYLGALLGIEKIMDYVGLEQLLLQNMSWIVPYMTSNFPIFILLLAVIIFIMKLFLHIAPAAIICTSIFLPLAELNGIHPWVIGFLILILSEMSFFPYQSDQFSLFAERTSLNEMCNAKKQYLFILSLNVVRLAAIFLSIPYWHWLGWL